MLRTYDELRIVCSRVAIGAGSDARAGFVGRHFAVEASRLWFEEETVT